MGSCAAPSAKGDDKFITTDYLQQCLPLLVSVSRKSFLGATVGLPVKDLGPASLAAELHAIGNGADYVRTHAPGDLRSAITFSETLAKFRSRDARDRGLDHA